MNDLLIFNNPEFGDIRIIDIDGRAYAVGNDIATVLEYAKPYKAISDHCKGALIWRILTNGGNQDMRVIPEGDIYRLIIKAASQSKSPAIRDKAERFERWIFDEVLPAIRKTGSYQSRPNPDDVLQSKLRLFEKLSQDCTTKQQIKMRIVALKETQAETGKDYSEVIGILSEKPDPLILSDTVTPEKIRRVLEAIRNTESIGVVSNGYIYIESPKFTRLMVKMGYDRRLTLKKMFALGLLRIGMDGNKRYTIQKRTNGRKISCVAVKWE